MAADAVEFVQRQMAFGDASIRRAVVTVNDAEAYSLEFGRPSATGAEGTLLTDLSIDGFGRCGAPDPVALELPGGRNVSSVTFTVEQIYDLEYPLGPRYLRLRLVAESAARPRPRRCPRSRSWSCASPTARRAPPLVDRIEFTQRQMAFLDASIHTAQVVINDEEVLPPRSGAPSADGSSPTPARI